jgi:hypothetical protein
MSKMEAMCGLTRTDSHRLNLVGLGIQTASDGSEDEDANECAPLRPVVKLPIIKFYIRPPTIKPRAVLDPVALKANEAENPHWRLAFAQDSQSIIFLDTRGLQIPLAPHRFLPTPCCYPFTCRNISRPLRANTIVDCPHLADLAVAREPNWINETITDHARENWRWLLDMHSQIEPQERATMDADENSEWRRRIAITLAEFQNAEEDRKVYEAAGGRRILSGLRG